MEETESKPLENTGKQSKTEKSDNKTRKSKSNNKDLAQIFSPELGNIMSNYVKEEEDVFKLGHGTRNDLPKFTTSS